LATEGPTGRAHFGFVYDASHEQALILGGYDGSAVFDDLWSWDGSAWTELEPGAPGPLSHLGLAVGGGRLVLFGGAGSASTFASLRDETWALADGAWSEIEGEGPSVRGSPAMAYDPDRGVFVLYGGFDAGGDLLGDTWELGDAWACVAGC
jgi:hypothetical protein